MVTRPHWYMHLRHYWFKWYWGSPHWADDKVAKMLGIARFGCPKCGHGAVKEEQAWRQQHG
jgi:hypothetical protein